MRHQHYDIVEMLLQHNVGTNCRDKWGRVPLCYCAEQGDAHLTQVLLDAGAAVNVAAPAGGGLSWASWSRYHTPLHAAAMSGDVTTIRCLVEKGADVTAKGQVESKSSTICP